MLQLHFMFKLLNFKQGMQQVLLTTVIAHKINLYITLLSWAFSIYASHSREFLVLLIAYFFILIPVANMMKMQILILHSLE